MTRLEDFIKAIEREIAKRRNVIELLQNAVKYYDNLGEEVNIVATVRQILKHFCYKFYLFQNSKWKEKFSNMKDE